MSHLVKNYIEQHYLFHPPREPAEAGGEPSLLHYPLGCQAGDPVTATFGNASASKKNAGGGYNEDAKRAYKETEVPTVCARHASPKYCVVYFHGNAESVKTLYPFIVDLSAVLEATVWAFEYPGYYEGSEKPSEKGCFQAAEKFCAYIQNVAQEPVVFFGYSMGCAMALHAALVHKAEDFPSAIVLLAPFMSAASVRLAHSQLTLLAAPLWAPIDVFRMRESALEQGHPLFVATGSNDDVVPPCHGEEISRVASIHGTSEHLSVPGATHASIRSDATEVLYDQMREFLHKNVQSRRV